MKNNTISRSLITIVKILFFFCCLISASVFAEELEVSFIEVKTKTALKSIGFVGVIEREKIYYITSKLRGIVDGLDTSFGKRVNKNTPLLFILPVDPGFTKSIIHSPIDDGIIVHRYIKNGHFVDVNDPLLQVASGHHYTIIVQAPNYEVKYFKSPQFIKAALYATTAESKAVPLGNINIQPPSNGRSLYRVEININCEKFACANTDLTGALVELKIDTTQSDELKIPRKALVNGEERVMLLTKDNKIQYRPVKISSSSDENNAVISHGLTAGDRVVIKYNFVPKEMQQVTIISQIDSAANVN